MIIKKIKLGAFGKFNNAEFDCAPITVFFGKNESGKSTIFDAIYNTISSPGGNTKYGQELVKRYGQKRNAEIVWDKEELKIPADEFLNVYAINEGSVAINFSSSSDWIKKIKASIFSGGIDPSTLAQEFEKLAAESGNARHVKELKNKRQELREAEISLNHLEEKKKEILKEEKRIEAKKKNLSELDSKISLLEQSIREGEEIITQQEIYRKLAEVRAIMERIVQYEKILRKKDELNAYEKDMSHNINEARAVLEKAKQVAEKAKQQREIQENEKKAVDARLREAKAKSEQMRRKSSLASELLHRIEASAPREIVTYELKWHPIGIIGMGASLVLGVVLFIWLYPSFLATLSLVGAVLTGILFAVLARSRHEVRQKPDTSQLCMAIQDQWKSRVDEALASTTLEGLQRELLRIQSEADVIDREIANFSNEEARIIEHISKAELEEKNAQALYENAKHTLEETYRALKVYSSEEYASRRTEYLKVKELYDELSARIENDKSIHNANTIDELKAACQLQQMSLEKECVAEKKSETESNRIKLKLEKDKAALSSLKEEFIKIKSDIESSKGELRGSFAELPKNIYEKEKKIARLKSEINILLRDMQAAAIARNIFLEIASDSDVIFTELENDIGHFIGDMLEGGRRIEFKNFSEDSILMTDAGGTMRTFNGLSTGTKDAFALAVRFSFALRSWEKEYPGIIVLDEPFHALDESRVSRIVDLIKKFHEEKAWQLVIFTKDEDLAKKLSRISNDVLMHVLPA